MEIYKGYYIEERSQTAGLMPTECVVYESEEKMTHSEYVQTFGSFDEARAWIDQNPPAPKYPDHIMEKVRQRLGLEPHDTSRDADINNMSQDEVFQHCLYWEGIIGYENTIKGWIKDIYGVELGDMYRYR